MHPCLLRTYTLYIQLGLKNTFLYRINGLVLLTSFLLVRVLYSPLAILIYAGQYHNWNIWSALKAMYPVCHFFNTVQFLLQTYWYLAIVNIALGAVRRTTNKPVTFLAQSSNARTSDVKCDWPIFCNIIILHQIIIVLFWMILTTRI